MAGAIAELVRVALARDFRRIDPQDARVVLVDAGEYLLARFPQDLSDYARACLERLGVEIEFGQRVQAVDEAGIRIGERFLPTAAVVWAAGVKVEGPGKWLDLAWQVQLELRGELVTITDAHFPALLERISVVSVALA